MSLLPKLEDITNHSASIEKFVVLLYHHSSKISTVSKCRKDLFARKGRLFKGIPPTSDALMQHLKRPFYQASFYWGQLLVAHKELPDLCQWGRKDSESGLKFNG